MAKETELSWEIIAWITGLDIRKGAYEREEVSIRFNPEWSAADFLAKDKNGRNALWYAAANAETEKYFLVLEKLKQERPDEYFSVFYHRDTQDQTILHDAAKCQNNAQIIRSILEEVRNTPEQLFIGRLSFEDYLNYRDEEFGNCPLILAAHYESWSNMEVLFEAGANPFIREYHNFETFDVLRAKSADMMQKFLNYFTNAQWPNKETKLTEYKEKLRKDMQDWRKDILRDAPERAQNILKKYSDACKQFNIIEEFKKRCAPEVTSQRIQEAVSKYQCLFKEYYDLKESWNQTIQKYKRTYEILQPWLKQDLPKKTLFSWKSFMELIPGVKRKKTDAHEIFMNIIKTQHDNLIEALHAINRPPRPEQKPLFKKLRLGRAFT